MKSGLARSLAAPPGASGRLELTLRSLRHTGLGEVALLVLALRLAWGLFAALALIMHPIGYPGGDWGELALRPGENGYYLIAPWQQWDALWYQKIALEGYRRVDAGTAFFPLFPMLMRFSGWALGGNLALGGLAVATGSAIVGLAALRHAVAVEFGHAAAKRTVLYVATFPTAFFLLAPYTESLFLTMAVVAISSARSGRWWVAGLAGLLAGLTRAQGMLLVAPLLYQLARHWRGRQPDLITAALATVLPAVGGLAFLSFGVWSTGGRTSAEQLNTYWGYELVAPWQAVGESWRHIANKGDAAEGLNLAALVVFCVAACLMVKRLPLSYVLYVAPQLALLATRQMWFSPLMSTSRYVLPLFPAFILLALYTRQRWLQQAIILGFMALQALFFYEFIHAGFVA